MELSQLRYFYEAAKTEHITRAAERLHVAQPALTKSVHALEEELGVRLFCKVGRRVRLTEYGVFLRDKLVPLIEELESLPQAVESLSDMAQKTVVINVLAASTALTDVIIAFKRQHPDALFKMLQKEGNEDCDILVTTGGAVPRAENVLRRESVEEQVFIAVPRTSPLAARAAVDLAELRHSDFVALSGSRRFRPLCDVFCTTVGFKPQISFESDSLIAVKNLVLAGVGVSFWPAFSWGEVKGEIKLLPISRPDCRREIALCRMARTPRSAAADAFYEFLVRRFREMCAAAGNFTKRP